jgi:hypothetical protein
MKKFIIIAVVLLIVAAGVVVFGLSKIGPLVKTAVNTYGPGITKTEVRLGDVNCLALFRPGQAQGFLSWKPGGIQCSRCDEGGQHPCGRR